MGNTDNSTEGGIYTQPPWIPPNTPLTPDLPGTNKYQVFPLGSNQFDIQQIVAAIDRLTTAIEKQNKLQVLALLSDGEYADARLTSDGERFFAMRHNVKLPSYRAIVKSKIRDIDSTYLPLEVECPTE